VLEEYGFTPDRVAETARSILASKEAQR
jgi:hypothetical protein